MLLTQDDIGHEYKIWIPCEADSDTVDDLVQQLVAIAGGHDCTSRARYLDK